MNYNYLLFVPSLLTKDKEIHYKVEAENVGDMSGRDYTGIQTNEAVTKFIIDYLVNFGEKLNKIIMLCTREVQNKQLSQIENRTTLEYYKESITSYIKEHGNLSDEEISQLFQVVDYRPEKNENENKIITALENIIEPDIATEYKKRLFVDFTGGLRSSALTLVFSSRILDKSGVEVSKILYSNLKTVDEQLVGSIEECTKTYRIFADFEEGIKLQNNIIDDEAGYEGKSEAEIKAHEEFNKMLEAKRMNQSQNAKESEKALDTMLENIEKTDMSHQKRKNIEQMAKKKEQIIQEINDPLLSIKNHLQKREDDKALSEFREKIANVLLSARIIGVKEQYKKDGKINGDMAINEIAAAYGYYSTYTDKSTFLKAMKDYVKRLKENPDKSPNEVKELYFGEKYMNISTYSKNGGWRGFKHNKFSREKCDDAIVSHIEKYYNQSRNMRETLRYYSLLDGVYMNYGFPFACTYGSQFYFHGYDNIYKTAFNNGVNCLQMFYEKKTNKKITRILNQYPEQNFDYHTLVDALNEKQYEHILRVIFPFQLHTKNIFRDALGHQEWSEFMCEFARVYHIVKAVRNKVTHPKNMEKEEIKEAIAELERIVEVIETLRNQIRGKDEEKNEK